MIVRKFLPTGIQAFRSFLAACRESPQTPVPHGLLEDEARTQAISPAIPIEPRRFARRGDAAEYLRTLLKPLPDSSVAGDAGLWTWLTLFFFEAVCPSVEGYRDVKNDYAYIFEPRNPRHFYRHLLFLAWRILCIAPNHNRLFLSGSLSSLDKVTSEVLKRLYVTRIPCIFEVLDRLYWDERRGRARVGITDQQSVKPGDLIHRFPVRMRQLEKTYDLFSLNAAQLIELLGDEFNFGAGSTMTAR